MAVIGWDVGGAHLKGARVEGGRVVAAVEVACALWQGIGRLGPAFAEARQALGDAPLHAVTMTGELSDVFASRAEGVAALCAAIAAALPGKIFVYGGREGWLGAEATAVRPAAAASMNWHATASLLARTRRDALFADMGSTTTDLVPIAEGRIAARGVTDAERLAAGELVYSGAARTSLMAVAHNVPFRGAWTRVMNEHFGTIADVHRILGELPENADRHAAADNREKSAGGSRARLARMIGRDAGEAAEREWENLARFFAEAQLQTVHHAALQVLSAVELSPDTPLVGAGSGAFVLRKLAARLGRRFEAWEATVPALPEAARMVGVCAPAAAVALLLAADQDAEA